MKYIFSIIIAISMIGIPYLAYADTLKQNIDEVFGGLQTYVNDRVQTIPMKSLKDKQEDRIWNRLTLSLVKNIKLGKESDRLMYQVLWTKVIERNNSYLLTSTSNLIQQWELITLINVLRENKGLATLTYNSELTQAAYRHALDLSTNFPYDADHDGSKEIIGHVGTDGTRVLQRVEDTGYPFSYLGENVAYNQILPNQVLADWIDSPTHYKNLICNHVDDIGVAKVGAYRVMVIGKTHGTN